MQWFDGAKSVVVKVTDISIALLALAIVLQILFGTAMPFLGGDIAANLVTFIKALGDKGLVGLAAIAAIVYILNRH
ncbi:MAG: Sec-independent protein translocase family protein [Alphaproteobacteria bacterium]